MADLPPIRREVRVAADPAVAFSVFTEQIATWWPLDTHSVHGADGSVAFEDGEIVERSAEGERTVWGAVFEWDPPHRIGFTWHPGRDEHPESGRVTVSFEPDGGGTLVTLQHAGWESHAHPEDARAEYGEGWIVVLDHYRKGVAA